MARCRLHKARAGEAEIVAKTNIVLELIIHKVKLILAERVKAIPLAPHGDDKNICEEKPTLDFSASARKAFCVICVFCVREIG